MEPKWFLKSKTILGLVVSILPTLLPAVGVSMQEGDTALISNTYDAIIQLAGVIIAVYGRFATAGKELKLLP